MRRLPLARRRPAGRPSARAQGLRPRRARPRGIALLMALTVVMLLTFFMSEYFFATGLELRAMTSFKDSQQSRMLAKSMFKAVQVALLQDEVDFFTGYNQLAKLLQVAAVPWNNGLLLSLEVVPQDALFNVNQNGDIRADTAQDRARRQIFLQLLEQLQVPVPTAPGTTQTLPLVTSEALYAAITDWIDSDSDPYLGFPSVRGAEADSYVGLPVQYDIKNGLLDRLTELRLVRGVKESGIPWKLWEDTVTALPKQSAGECSANYLTERVNVNVASRQQIATFLATHLEDPNEVGGDQEVIKGIVPYAQAADALADFFAPADGTRKTYDPDSLQAALQQQGFTDKYGVNCLFSTVDQYYRIRIVTEVGDVEARLEAMLNVPRDPKTRLAKGTPKVLWETVN
jgi:type II secretory pathway component PulK